MGFMDQFRQQQLPQTPVQQQQATPQQRAQLLGDRLRAVRGMVGGNPSAFIDYLRQNDSEFAAFLQGVQGKTPQQAFQEHGLDFSQFQNLL